MNIQTPRMSGLLSTMTRLMLVGCVFAASPVAFGQWHSHSGYVGLQVAGLHGGSLSLGSQWSHGGLGRYSWHAGHGIGWSCYRTPWPAGFCGLGGFYNHSCSLSAYPFSLNRGWSVGGFAPRYSWRAWAPSYWVAPPVYVRNYDLAIFPPLWGGCYSGYYGYPMVLPSYGFASPLWPAVGMVPSVVDMQLANSDSAVQPSAPQGMRVSAIPPVPAVPNQTEFAAASLSMPASGTVPILNEFPAVPCPQTIASGIDRIQSLRQQAAGDEAFRRADYASAESSYSAAISTAPQRRAPWFRLAIVKLARKDFDQATSHLKTGLQMPADQTRAWITLDELYGRNGDERSREQAAPLWDWVSRQPLSTDRLLLAGTFQELRGFHDTADELLAMSMERGDDREKSYVSSLQTVITGDRELHAALTETPALPARFRTTSASKLLSSSQPADDRQPQDRPPIAGQGIRMRSDTSAVPLPLPSQPLKKTPAPPLPAEWLAPEPAPGNQQGLPSPPPLVVPSED